MSRLNHKELIVNEMNSVAEWVSEQFARAKLFEKWGIDFCCGGKKSLKEACEEKDLALEEVMFQLRTLRAVPVAIGSSAKELCDHIEEVHHAYLKEAFPRIQSHLAKIVKAHGKKYRALQKTFDEFAEEMEAHMMKEEQVVFPLFRSSDPKRMKYCQELEEEHKEMERLLETLRSLTDNYRPPNHACATLSVTWSELEELERDTHLHVYKENHLLFGKIK